MSKKALFGLDVRTQHSSSSTTMGIMQRVTDTIALPAGALTSLDPAAQNILLPISLEKAVLKTEVTEFQLGYHEDLRKRIMKPKEQSDQSQLEIAVIEAPAEDALQNQKYQFEDVAYNYEVHARDNIAEGAPAQQQQGELKVPEKRYLQLKTQENANA